MNLELLLQIYAFNSSLKIGVQRDSLITAKLGGTRVLLNSWVLIYILTLPNSSMHSPLSSHPSSLLSIGRKNHRVRKELRYLISRSPTCQSMTPQHTSTAQHLSFLWSHSAV